MANRCASFVSSIVLAVLFAAPACEASSITYDVNLTITDGVNTTTITGNIVTDGVIGPLAAGTHGIFQGEVGPPPGGDIVSWDLFFNFGTPAFPTTELTTSNSSYSEGVGPLSATSSQLVDGADANRGPGAFFMLGSSVPGSGGTLIPELCLSDSLNCGVYSPFNVGTVRIFNGLSEPYYVAETVGTGPVVPLFLSSLLSL